MERVVFLIKLLAGVLLVWLIGACSAERTNVVSVTYHNTTALYNAYFIANEHIKTIEKAIFDNHEDNYNEILSILPPIDTSFTRSLEDKLEDVIKKASLPIQRHQNSKWVDDSYVLVGKARLYSGDYTNAIETFKYVNTHSEDRHARHQALTNLMRTFIEYEEYNNAIAVFDHMKKEKISDENKHDFFLTTAYLYQLSRDYQNMVRFLNAAIELSKKKDHLARKYFIAGQVYQKFGYDSAAYSNYQKCLKSNPPYELSFYAKLNMAQATQVAKSKDVKKVRRYFTKLLKDKKNKEYRDKIYYEVARFEIKQGNHDEAVSMLKKSVASSEANQRQKGYSYLKLGELHYEHYKKYTLSKLYYDSTVATLPADDQQYEAVQARHKILVDFVDNYNTIQEQDSLLRLANMSETALLALLDEVIQQKEMEEQKQEQERKRIERRASASQFSQDDTPFDAMATNSQGGVWYFYNSSAISAGRNEFLRKWGNRALEDNWRRSRKEVAAADDGGETEEEEVPDEVPKTKEELAREKEFSRDAAKTAMMASIPFSEEEQAQALTKIEVAYYNLGNIYNFQLLEKQNAISTFEEMLGRFPQSEYKPEVLYQLYLLYKAKNDPAFEKYKNELLTHFPDTDYAKLIENPNFYAEQEAAENRLQKLYNIAYDYYRNENFNEAGLLVSRALQQYPDNPFSDHLKILDILITAKTDGVHKYQYELQQFIENNEESELKTYAEQLLQASRNLEEKEIRKKGITYISDLELEYFYIILYENTGTIADKIAESVDHHITNNMPDAGLTVGNLTFDDRTGMLLVNEFENMEEAQKFLQLMVGKNSPVAPFRNDNMEDYIITKENFEILYQSKAIKEYRDFYQKHYSE